jgi:uncharacterized protein YkwD
VDITSFLSSITIPNLGLNWVDILVIAVLTFYTIEGYSLGFVAAFVDFTAFVFSFLLGITLYNSVGNLLVDIFSIPRGFANAIGFFIVAVIFEVIFNLVLKNLISNIPLVGKQKYNDEITQKFNKIFGFIPGFMSGLVLSAFILSLIIALPFSVFLKHSITKSKIGGVLVYNTQGFAKDWSNVFGGAVNDTLSFLTVEPKSSESVALNFKVKNTTVDKKAEQEMLDLVNFERTSRGFHSLTFSETLAKVGRAYCKDMFERGYFSHYSPEGLSPFDRMAKADIPFNYAGENLALAPSVDLAMKGLMQSPGHKANILSENFRQVGIGVIDGGIYGQMYCQEFTD